MSRHTQRARIGDLENVAHSITWPECKEDYIPGYGSQTEPHREPGDPLERAELIEIDYPANAPDP